MTERYGRNTENQSCEPFIHRVNSLTAQNQSIDWQLAKLKRRNFLKKHNLKKTKHKNLQIINEQEKQIIEISLNNAIQDAENRLSNFSKTQKAIE